MIMQNTQDNKKTTRNCPKKNGIKFKRSTAKFPFSWHIKRYSIANSACKTTKTLCSVIKFSLK